MATVAWRLPAAQTSSGDFRRIFLLDKVLAGFEAFWAKYTVIPTLWKWWAGLKKIRPPALLKQLFGPFFWKKKIGRAEGYAELDLLFVGESHTPQKKVCENR